MLNQGFIVVLRSGGGALLLLGIGLFVIGIPFLIILYLLCPKRQIQVGNSQLVITDGKQYFGYIAFPEIAHARVTGSNRRLEVFDHMRNLRIDFKPFWGEEKIDEAVDFLCTLIPSSENRVEQQEGKTTFTNRFIDAAPPPQATHPGWQAQQPPIPQHPQPPVSQPPMAPPPPTQQPTASQPPPPQRPQFLPPQP
ncbi:MAG: hypothetical protein Q4D79_12235 [Propionibacteriaceae bacterium]|nr:hypothetical protein [Propionibacteriaceae bacterium]